MTGFPTLSGAITLAQPTALDIRDMARKFRGMFGSSARITISGTFGALTIQTRVTGIGPDSVSLAGNIPDVDPAMGRDVRVTFTQEPEKK